MRLLDRLIRIVAGPKHAVASLGSYADVNDAYRFEGRPFCTLVAHLFARLFESVDASNSSNMTTRILQLASSLGVPGMMFALALIPSYYGAAPLGLHRPYWSTVQDHYVYTVYSFVVIGVVSLIRWDSFFPDLLEVRILGVLPITQKRLFSAKVTAGMLYLLLFLVGANLAGTIFLPAIAESSNYLRHVTGHVIALTMAAIFAASMSISLVGLVIVVSRGRSSRAVAPLLQAALLACLLILLFLTPVIMPLLKPLLESNARVLLWFPPVWFLGLYQVVMGASAGSPVFSALAALAVEATTGSVLLLLIVYPMAYRLRLKQLIESDGGASSRPSSVVRMMALIERSYLPSAAQRATYYFVAQTFFRVQQYRIYLALSASVGIAFAIMAVARFRERAGDVEVVFRGSRMPFGLSLLLVCELGGIFLLLRSSHEIRAAWIFDTIVSGPTRGLVSGVRRLMFAVAGSIVLCFALLSKFFLQQSLSGSYPSLYLFLAGTGCSVVLVEIFLFVFRGVPFTADGNRGQEGSVLLQFCFAAAVVFFVAKPVTVSSKLGLVFASFCVAALITAVLLLHWRYGKAVYQPIRTDDDDGYQRLGL